MISYPALVYKSPGAYTKPNGTYQTATAFDDDAMAELMALGWFKTAQEAIEKAGDKAYPVTRKKPAKPVKKIKPSKPFNAPKPAPAAEVAEVAEVSDNATPTRAEMEEQATKLNIKFDGRTRDHKLLQLITDKLGA
jgi:hypothetical protein